MSMFCVSSDLDRKVICCERKDLWFSRRNVVHSNLSLDTCLMANALREGKADLPSVVWDVGKGLV